jgi:hypothetical protein
MVKPRWLAVNKKKMLGMVVMILLLAGLYRGTTAYYTRVNVPPEELVAAALENTLNSSSCRFSILVKTGESVISNVRGERVAPNSVHISGTMQDLPVEFIHAGDETFIKGYWSDNWTSLKGNKMAESELFITEFNPLGNFNFKDIPYIKTIKTEEFKSIKMKVLELRPIVQNSLMELNYEDFIYRVWIDPKQQLIRKAHIQASGKNGKKDKLEITLELWDYNKQITITPPDAS